jgi:hypothetical protein
MDPILFGPDFSTVRKSTGRNGRGQQIAMADQGENFLNYTLGRKYPLGNKYFPGENGREPGSRAHPKAGDIILPGG